ncbi:membrane protein insertase YidC [Frondihabitans sp. VKM Ac-2883]|uniref:membrane protein insertase YidC n=1 Tax=Frondihabitans sp. VKM Ac-2883 TaxID=2783823 RepID=UPI00188A2248|nr:membrane protein insertase YidC [Frondihabitans sp. VKM Ac-2883]MBF4575162.1 membrane protein insertase YidC [Frondihabitans sp. VKM Ac-2883]
MLDFIGTILWPIRWVVEAILVGWHYVLTSVGLDADAGVTWVLSIVLLTIVVRVCLIPIFVRQIKNQRRMMEVAPQLKKIQDKYKGKKDQFSREAMSRETMALYKETGTNPLSSCLPLLIQMPVFFSLYTVLHNAQLDKVGIGLLNRDLSNAFATSTLFGAPLKETFTNSDVISVKIIAGAMIVLMTASQFFTQLQLTTKNMSPETKASPMYKQQKMLLYVLPLVFLFSGLSFPLGVMFYWLTSNFWTMGQQYVVIRNSPTPGSDAALAREARLAKRQQDREARGKGNPLKSLTEITVTEIETPKRVTTQRSQPVGKARSKKQNGQAR